MSRCSDSTVMANFNSDANLAGGGNLALVGEVKSRWDRCAGWPSPSEYELILPLARKLYQSFGYMYGTKV